MIGGAHVFRNVWRTCGIKRGRPAPSKAGTARRTSSVASTASMIELATDGNEQPITAPSRMAQEMEGATLSLVFLNRKFVFTARSVQS